MEAARPIVVQLCAPPGPGEGEPVADAPAWGRPRADAPRLVLVLDDAPLALGLRFGTVASRRRFEHRLRGAGRGR